MRIKVRNEVQKTKSKSEKSEKKIIDGKKDRGIKISEIKKTVCCEKPKNSKIQSKNRNQQKIK